MKKVTIFMLAVFLISCHNYKKDAEQLQVKVDSLQTVAMQKESVIESYLNDFSEIQANLDSIKKMEDLIAMPGEPESEISEDEKAGILADISAINDLLVKNNELIASLRRRLSNASLKTGKLESMVNDLEKKTKILEESINRKDDQIAGLTGKVEEQSENIEQLNNQIDVIQKVADRRLDSLEQKEEAFNRAYFISGTVSELKDNGVVEREGGILGIGSTPVVKKDFSRDAFKQVDKRDFDYLPINSRKANLISVHPAGSFHITGENSADTLFIDNPGEFWSVSKYLVVVSK